MESPAIHIDGLTKRFGNFTAVDRLTLDVAVGEVFGSLGPNGAGKSTTLRLLLGLIRPTAGRASIMGIGVGDVKAAHWCLAFVPGDVNLWPRLTGGECLELLANFHGSVDLAYRDALVEQFRLDTAKKARTYSKGNRQKVALIAAFATRAEVLLLDEPTSGLDPLTSGGVGKIRTEGAALRLAAGSVSRRALILTGTLAVIVVATIGGYSGSGLTASSLSGLSTDPSIRALYGASGTRGPAAWGGGLAVFGLVVGAITGTITDFLASNPAIERATENADLGRLLSTAGFVATMDSFAALLIGFYVVSSLHVVSEDEDDGRLELVYAASVTRIGWLGAQVLVTGLFAVVLGLIASAGIWVGNMAGSTSLSFRQSSVGMLNVLPLGALALGLAVLLYGVRPTLVVPVTGGALVAGYLMTFLQPALNLSDRMLDLSPFHHRALVPAQPVAWVSTLVMLAVAACLVVAGSMAFAARDLR